MSGTESEIDCEIARLLREHPGRFVGFSVADLANWDDTTKAILLGDIKEMLGLPRAA